MQRLVPWIPASRPRVVRLLKSKLANSSIPNAGKFQELTRHLDTLLTIKTRNNLQYLKFHYDPVDPDRPERNPYIDKESSRSYLTAQVKLKESRFLNSFDTFVQKANFHKLTAEELQMHVFNDRITQDGLKIHVNREFYSTLEVYVSGIKPEPPPKPLKNVYEFLAQLYLTLELFIYGPLFRLLHGKEFEKKSSLLYNHVIGWRFLAKNLVFSNISNY